MRQSIGYADWAPVGPYVQFTSPHSAVVRWDTGSVVDSIVEYGTSESSLTMRIYDADTTTEHEINLGELYLKNKYFYRIGYSNDGQEIFSEVHWFDNNINYSRVDVSGANSPYPTDSLTTLYEQAADQFAAQSGITKGVCLVYGCGEGRLAFELAKRTDMMIVGVDTDNDKITSAIGKLIEAGVYGSRITLRHVLSMNSLPFNKYTANLVVSDTMISEGVCPGSAQEMFRVLRPSGGVAYLGQPAGCPNVLTQHEMATWLNSYFSPNDYDLTDDDRGLWTVLARSELPGAGWWSHAYGGAHNNGNSGDALEGGTRIGDFDLQWISWPGADAK